MSLAAEVETASGPDSVVREMWGEWSKLRDINPLAQLHAKFWRKSMADEEWRRPQKSVGDSPGGVTDESMDVDVDDDEIGPGSYILDIGIKGLSYSKIWIRADYIRIYDYCNDHYNRSMSIFLLSNKKEAPSVVITGQPGIGKRSFRVGNFRLIWQAGKGKSVWIYYAVCRRLSEGKPVIWYRDQRRYLFVGAGVFETPKDFPSSYSKPFIWTFVDWDGGEDGVPSRLVTEGTRHFVIFTTSPCRKQWWRMRKTTNFTRAIMDPWIENEILQV